MHGSTPEASKHKIHGVWAWLNGWCVADSWCIGGGYISTEGIRLSQDPCWPMSYRTFMNYGYCSLWCTTSTSSYNYSLNVACWDSCLNSSGKTVCDVSLPYKFCYFSYVSWRLTSNIKLPKCCEVMLNGSFNTYDFKLFRHYPYIWFLLKNIG